jgi:hypothetical protein
MQLFQLITLAWGLIALAFIVPSAGLLSPTAGKVPIAAMLVSFGVFSFVAWWRARSTRGWAPAFFVAHLVALDAIWFPAAGSTGATLLFNVSLIMLPIVFAGGLTRGLMIGSIFANLALLYGLEYLHPEWLTPYTNALERTLDIVITTSIALVGIAVTMWVVLRGYRLERQRLAAANAELARTLAEVRTLRGLLSMCSWCGRIRDEDGSWSRVEAYVQSHTEARMTHGLCPDCAARMERELDPAPGT